MGLRRISRKWDEVAARGCAVALAVTAALAACSSTPSAVNPFELYRSAAGLTVNDDTTGARNAQNLEAGRNEPYPNLGTVPPPPDRAMSSIDRQKLQQGLVDDRAQAKQTDANLRESQSGAAPMGLPTPITRPSSSGDAMASAPVKPKVDASHPSTQSATNTTRHRSSPGSETPPDESSLTIATVHAMPEGDTPRPAPPPPSVPPPEKARKAPDQMAKVQPVGNSVKRVPPPPQTTAAATPPDAGVQASSADTAAANAGTAVAPPAATPPMTVDPPAARVPPPPPADMMTPPSDKIASADPARSPSPATPVPPAPPASAPPSASAPTAWPSSLSASDTLKPASEQTAALDPARPPQPLPTTPVPPAVPPAAKPPEPSQAALAPPAATAAPTPSPGRSGSVSLQAAEINFASNGLTLTPDDDRRLADVIKLYDKHGGLVRVVGYGRRGFGADAAQQELASFSKAIERANVVARALTQLGLASNRIVVQAAPIGDGLGEDRAEVLLEF